MRSAKDIKKGQQCCGSGGCDECPYKGTGTSYRTCCDAMTADTQKYIALLEKQLRKTGEKTPGTEGHA